jgi:hypothetical protein
MNGERLRGYTREKKNDYEEVIVLSDLTLNRHSSSSSSGVGVIRGRELQFMHMYSNFGGTALLYILFLTADRNKYLSVRLDYFMLAVLILVSVSFHCS